MEDFIGVNNTSQNSVTVDEAKVRELEARLTPEFLQTLHDFATHIGWGVDLIEISKFVELAYIHSNSDAVFKQIEY